MHSIWVLIFQKVKRDIKYDQYRMSQKIIYSVTPAEILLNFEQGESIKDNT